MCDLEKRIIDVIFSLDLGKDDPCPSDIFKNCIKKLNSLEEKRNSRWWKILSNICKENLDLSDYVGLYIGVYDEVDRYFTRVESRDTITPKKMCKLVYNEELLSIKKDRKYIEDHPQDRENYMFEREINYFNKLLNKELTANILMGSNSDIKHPLAYPTDIKRMHVFRYLLAQILDENENAGCEDVRELIDDVKTDEVISNYLRTSLRTPEDVISYVIDNIGKSLDKDIITVSSSDQDMLPYYKEILNDSIVLEMYFSPAISDKLITNLSEMIAKSRLIVMYGLELNNNRLENLIKSNFSNLSKIKEFERKSVGFRLAYFEKYFKNASDHFLKKCVFATHDPHLAKLHNSERFFNLGILFSQTDSEMQELILEVLARNLPLISDVHHLDSLAKIQNLIKSQNMLSYKAIMIKIYCSIFASRS